MRRLLELFWVFFKIGAFTVGGGYAMIPLIKSELVDRKKWIDDEFFIDALAVAQSSPGPIAVNVAVFLGMKLKGLSGLLFAVFGAVLPSFIIILAVAVLFQNIQNNPYFIAAFKAVKPAVVALILAPVLSLSKKADIKGFKWLIPLTVGGLIAYIDVSPVLFVALAMVGGNLFCGKGK